MKDNVKDSVVYIVDDDESLCQSLVYLLDSVKIRSKVYYTPELFLDEYRRSQPSCLLLDIRMPNFTGLQLQDLLGSRNVMLPIIFMTGHGDVSSAVRVMKKGAFDFFTKPFNHHLLLESIQKAIARDTISFTLENNHKIIKSLTSQESNILELIISGKSSKAIANQVNLSYKTVEYHRAKIMRKLGAKNLAQLMQLYYKHLFYSKGPKEHACFYTRSG